MRAAPRAVHRRLAGWGRHLPVSGPVVEPRDAEEAIAAVRELRSWSPRGNGRSYGDAGVGVDATLDLRQLNRFKSFDPERGVLRAEAGVLIGEVIEAFLPRGWFPTVVPGTQFVSLGGAVAADVHGKNHHGHGGFGGTVRSFTLAAPGAGVLRVSADAMPEIHRATVGGMGLTGAILDVELQLQPVESGWIRQRTVASADLAQTMRHLRDDQATYSVSWIDCLARGPQLGRALVYLGEHATADEVRAAGRRPLFPPPRSSPIRVPVEAPAIALHPFNVRMFNELYYRLGVRKDGRSDLVGWEPYFFPLDGIHDWNLIYGRRGFVQHQCVLPFHTAEGALASILEQAARRGTGSFLAVLKTLGPSEGDLSFPMGGYTLALDFPVQDGLFDFLSALDKVVVDAGGRLYLAKDAAQARGTFEAGYPRLSAFRNVRESLGAAGRIRSRLSERLGL